MFRFYEFVEKAEKSAQLALNIDDKTKLTMMTNYFNNIQSSKDKQNKAYEIMTKESNEVDDFDTIIEIISNEYQIEYTTKKKEKASYLIALLVRGLKKSTITWKKIIRLIAPGSGDDYRKSLKNMFNINCFYEIIVNSIDNYFKSLVQIEDTYVINTVNLENDEFKHLKNLQLSEIILLFHFIIHSDYGSEVSHKFFGDENDLNPAFVNFLKCSLKILDM